MHNNTEVRVKEWKNIYLKYQKMMAHNVSEFINGSFILLVLVLSIFSATLYSLLLSTTLKAAIMKEGIVMQIRLGKKVMRYSRNLMKDSF